MLVILAILAAIMVPALLGWIDKAKEKQYTLEARSIYMAAQGLADEKYAIDEDHTTGIDATYLNGKAEEIEKLSDVTGVEFADTIQTNGTDAHGIYTIADMQVSFVSQDGSYVGATLENGTWTIKTGTSKVAPPEYVNSI